MKTKGESVVIYKSGQLKQSFVQSLGFFGYFVGMLCLPIIFLQHIFLSGAIFIVAATASVSIK